MPRFTRLIEKLTSAGARPGRPWLCLEEEEEKGEGRRNGRSHYKLNSRAWANLTDLPTIASRSPMAFCLFGFRAYIDPLEIHWANLTDLPIIAFRSPTEIWRLSFRAYTDPLEIHCAVN